jgi:hypothetical protein
MFFRPEHQSSNPAAGEPPLDVALVLAESRTTLLFLESYGDYTIFSLNFEAAASGNRINHLRRPYSLAARLWPKPILICVSSIVDN